MNYLLFDDNSWENLLPLTFMRPVAEIRIGILTMKEKWEKILGESCFYYTRNYLQEKYPFIKSLENTVINASVFPSEEIVTEIQKIDFNTALVKEGELIAVKINDIKLDESNLNNFHEFKQKELNASIQKVRFPWDIFRMNGQEIEKDFALITNGRKSAELSTSNQLLGKENIFAEPGVNVECSIINARNGKIYLGRNSTIMEGCIIHGSLALGEGSVIKMGAKIYGPTTAGPQCRLGGEINNSVMIGYSNKGHDGFLGNSVLGQWCNLGADTNTSNLKNNYAEVKLWNYENERFLRSGQQFCGLIMGDHSKCGINTMFNTGTVVGVSANLFGSGFPRNFVPSFSWGGAAGFTTYQPQKAFDVAEKVMSRRDKKLEENDKKILTAIFEKTAKYRRWES